ncbi:MAG TPA: hypothetical protein VLB50_03040 [Ignavibacteriaceae bacterium]|nr:hypothetical protein [Ignavibacteriaceae bacterium]
MQKIIRIIILSGLLLSGLAFFISFTGCSSSPGLIEQYPDFLNRKEHISSISLCTDVLVFFDGVESGVIIDIPLSKEVGDSILSIFKRELEKKNYPVDEIYPAAVGYSMGGDERHYRVFETKEDYSRNTSSLKLVSPPFIMEDKFLEVEDLLNGKLEAVSAGYGTGNFEQTPEGEYLLYCYVEGTNVSFTKQLGESFLSSLLSAGKLESHPVSGSNISYQLFDLQTGVVVLSDGRILENSDINGDNIADPLVDMLEEIPAKVSAFK